ncbi:MAG: hypothetical protein U0166_14740 [Acidobacteriota bacterium]
MAREITGEQIEALARWLDSDPDVPDGEWFKVLSKVVVCGEGPLIKTFLRAGQAPRGSGSREHEGESTLRIRSGHPAR